VEAIRITAKETNESWEIPVLHEDEDLLALDKPSGLLTSPDRYDPLRPNMMRLLHEAIARPAPWAARRGLTYLMNAHRLDFETSGILLLAKNKPALITLANMFGSRQPPVKRYAALVQGRPVETEFLVDVKLAQNPLKPGRMKVDQKNGKASSTRFVVREQFVNCALVDCFPLTGRTHQIRVHLAHAHHPIIGDAVYRGAPLWLSSLKANYHLKPGKEERPLMGRPALHAEGLELPHPRTNQPVAIHAPWPKDLVVAVRYLRRYSLSA
jgi:RluA family pseudouridine synthase